MKNRTHKEFEITLPQSIIVRNLCTAKDSASRSAQLFLTEARNATDSARCEALESLAIERALFADQIEAIAKDRFGVDISNFNKSGHASPDAASATIRNSESLLKRCCDKLYRRCNDNALKRYLRDLRADLHGLAATSGTHRAPAVTASISM